MKRVFDFPQIYLYRPFVDMRKQAHGLAVLVKEGLRQNPFDEGLYLFCNRRRDLLKALYWDQTGFALWIKKLDREKFSWPRKLTDEVIVLGPREIEWLLGGYDVWKMKSHKPLRLSKIS